MLLLDFANGIPHFQPAADWQLPIAQFLDQWGSNKPIAFETSGTTGAPRTIFHSRKFLEESAMASLRALKVDAGGLCLLVLPADKTGGRMLLARAIAARVKVYCVRPSLTPLEAIESFPDSITLASFTPAQLLASLQLQHSRNCFSIIETALIGGAAVTAPLLELLKGFGVHCFESFGSTETAGPIALRQLTPVTETCFTCLPDVQIDADTEGHLLVRLSSGFTNPLRTNDVVQLMRNKSQFIWLGRSDNVINSGGLKLYPEQIEEKLRPHIKLPFFVGAIPDDVLGEKPVLYVECREFSSDWSEMLEKAISILPRHEQPRAVKAVTSFVYAGGDKLNRKASAAL